MREGQKYGLRDLAGKVDRSLNVVRKLLSAMVLDETLVVTIDGKSRYYELAGDDEADAQPTPGRYAPEWKPLGLHDIRAHQRLAEGARHNETGLV